MGGFGCAPELQRIVMAMRRNDTNSNERGAVLPLIAIMIAAVTTFAALAVDLGNVTNERRQDQSTADAAALGA
ncbi:MAG: pilus assembly protein TadG-related protein, partial [Acidimicrobiia bacterium]|nr:pilus assembly protein TadG-related protein [Acidimicrobiia bacterium]